MGKRALVITTVSGFVPQFEMGNVEILQSLGYEVHYASNYRMPFYGKDNSRLDGTGIVRHQVDFVRSPFCIKENLKAFRQLRRLQKREKFDLVHCHTPMGGVLGRLVFGVFGKGRCKVLYTAHGFHFYKGAPLKNWLLYYPVEKLLSWWTDAIITINREDYARAKRLKAKNAYYIPGVGIDVEKYMNMSEKREEKRRELNIPQDSFVILSVGELMEHKNHEVIIRALGLCKKKDIYYVLCGKGPLESELKKLAKQEGILDKVIFAGYRQDVPELCGCADVMAHPSKREGLGIAALEGMASGLPLICTWVGGIKDYAKDGRTGSCIARPGDASGFKDAILSYYSDRKKALEIGERNRNYVKRFDIRNTRKAMSKIYREQMGENCLG